MILPVGERDRNSGTIRTPKTRTWMILNELFAFFLVEFGLTTDSSYQKCVKENTKILLAYLLTLFVLCTMLTCAYDVLSIDSLSFHKLIK